MADGTKHMQSNANLIMDLKNLFAVLKTRRTMLFAYGFMFAFVLCTVFLAFNPSANSSPWYNRIFSSTSSSSLRSQFSSIFSYFSPNSSISTPEILNQNSNFTTSFNTTSSQSKPPDRNEVSAKNETEKGDTNETGKGVTAKTRVIDQPKKNEASNAKKNETVKGVTGETRVNAKKNETVKGDTGDISVLDQSSKKKNGTVKAIVEKTKGLNLTTTESLKPKKENLLESLSHCDIFDGRWVKDESYPLYRQGSCAHIDEPFNCILNGRPDKDYQKLRWQPKGCNIPRLNGSDMLQRLKGKRLVFVGDSLNRNMWESLVCVLENSVKDKSKVFEASGRSEFRTLGSYSFIFKDYNCSIEFFRSPFLVQEWEISDTNGTKETLRLDKIEPSSSKYKDADIIVFNTGHWWTHEKTSKGKDYYQEGSHIYGQLNVVVAFGKALKTWAKWVDANINPKKTLVFFRGYSASHFSGGRWNSGGQCDSETEPIKNDTYLAPYPPKMNVLESVMMGMKTPISYLNITRMTDYRKDGHPSVYRKRNLPEEERRSPLRYQDCSHWCLPGVPDIWNELLYAQLLIKQH